MAFFVQLYGGRAQSLINPVERLADCKYEVIARIEELSPEADICLAWGVYKILKPHFLTIPKRGIWGFHESPLPKGRGCAPLHWTVLGGHKEATVSFFQFADKMDSGPLIDQETFPILKSDFLEHLREKARLAVGKMIDRSLLPFLRGELTPREQTEEPTFFAKRSPQDSRLDSSKSLDELWDLIRVCDNDEYPAWFEVDGEKILLRRSKS